MAITLASQKLMAFEGLVTWSKAVVIQGDRLSGALKLMREPMRDFAEARETKQAFEVERHFFCIAAAKFIEYRRWVVELKLIEPGIFAEVDRFEADVKAMRDLNEHAREYFMGPGLRRQDWDANMKRFNSDPTGTSETRIGGRLDWVKLQEAVSKLVPQVPDMLPSIYQDLHAEKNLPV